MAIVEMVMPKMGESIMEATILEWLKNEGDQIEQDESVLEVATDKVDTEVPCTHEGILKEILAKKGDIVPVGQPIAIIETIEEIKHPLGLDDLPDDYEHPDELSIPDISNVTSRRGNGINELSKPESHRFFSPLVKSIARQENISLDEIDQIVGTGKKDRLTKKDILAYIAEKKAREAAKIQKVISIAERPLPADYDEFEDASFPAGEDEIIEMDRMRTMISERMVESKRISPHVTSFVEADVTSVVLWRQRVKDGYEKKYGQKLTYTPLFLEAVIQSIKDFPMVNVSVDGNKIIKHNKINIGIAVALPGYNLIVPVIKNANQYSLNGLVAKVNDIIYRSRNNQLKPDDLSDGTYTVTNVGSFGNVMGTPIIMQPQVAILATGIITKKPSVIETPTGDVIGIRHKMFLSHSYDHRVVDGALGGSFLRRVADYLEQYNIQREI